MNDDTPLDVDEVDRWLMDDVGESPLGPLFDTLGRIERHMVVAGDELEAVDPDDEESQRKACVAVKNLVGAIRVLEDDLVAVRDDFEAQLASAMPFTRKDFDDWGRVEIRSSTTRRWDHERLLSVVMARARDHAVDTETGEMVDPLVVAEEMLRKVAAFAYWRLGNLKNDLGIDGASYADTTYGRKRVIFK